MEGARAWEMAGRWLAGGRERVGGACDAGAFRGAAERGTWCGGRAVGARAHGRAGGACLGNGWRRRAAVDGVAGAMEASR